METTKFNPNMENVKKRANIKPFGSIPQYSKVKAVPVQFKLHKDPHEMQMILEENDAETYEANVYVPPVPRDFKFTDTYNHTTVRLTNLPLKLTRDELMDILSKESGMFFNNINIVKDKETNLSKGIAYINFSEQKTAVKFAKKIMNIVIDNLKLAVEVLDRK